MKYDYLIVGAGPFGCTFAHEKTKQGYKVLVIDKRDHIGGNCYTERIHKIDVHKYGAHIFHTKSKKIWNYVNQFATFNNYIHKVMVHDGKRIYSFPINLLTLHQLWGDKVTTPTEAKNHLDLVKINIPNPSNFSEWVLSQVGPEIYNKFYYGYTKKQWRREPKDVPINIAKRLPIRLNYDDRYFGNDYQGIPEQGYTDIFRKMLDGSEIQLNHDFFSDRATFNRIAKKIVFTGRIDEYYEYKHGPLDYRSLYFAHRLTNGDHQGNSVINYTNLKVKYTRVIEHKHFNCRNDHKTIVSYEYPTEYTIDKEPYYPVCDQENMDLYDKYRNEGDDTIFGGRLGTFKYYDMDQVIAQALSMASRK